MRLPAAAVAAVCLAAGGLAAGCSPGPGQDQGQRKTHPVVSRTPPPPDPRTASALLKVATVFNDEYDRGDYGPVYDRWDARSQAVINRALASTRETELTVTGRKSGREITIPVWFVQEGERLYLLPIHGSDSDWYKNVLKEPEIRLAAEGERITARARPITDPAGAARVVDMFRAKYGVQDVENYYPKRNVAAEVPLT